MDNLAEILEQELEEAVEIKNKKSLHRYIVLLTENIDKKSTYDQSLLEVKNEIKLLAETMKQGFKSVDKRFEDMYKYIDRRFEAENTRFEDKIKFTMKFIFMNIGFVILIFLMILFNLLP